jgi:hypothetical protein
LRISARAGIFRGVQSITGATLDDPDIERLLGRRPRLSYDDIVGHPRLPQARKVYIDDFLKIYGDDPFLVRLLIETGRFQVFHLATVLEAAYDPARRETWPTVGLLKQTIAMLGLRGIASARHVDHLIGRLRAVGYMQLQPSDQDRRIKLLRITERLRTHDRDWLAAHYAPLAVLYPQYDYGLALRRDPGFQAAQRRASLAFAHVGAKIFKAVPADMMLFLDRAGGFPVLAALLQAAMADPTNPHAAVPYTDVGDRFGVSRTHVRRLLSAAQDAGLVKLQARGGHRVEILPRLWASHDRGISCGMYLHDMLYLAATNALSAADSPVAKVDQPLA